MCGRYFLELKALMELEKCVDYEFERELLIARSEERRVGKECRL